MPEFKIRPGIREDSAKIAEVFLMAGDDAIRWIFGKNADAILKDLTNLKLSPFSWSRSQVMEVDGSFAGAIVTYPMGLESELNKGLDRIWQKHYNFLSLLGFIYRVKKWEKNTPKPKDSCYIHAVAVLEQYRGMGIAGRLLEQVQKTAKAEGQQSLALEVVSDNKPAIRTYEKFGFEYCYEIPMSKISLFLINDETVIYAMKKDI